MKGLRLVLVLAFLAVFINFTYAAPVVNLNYPPENANLSGTVNFNCSATSSPANLSNITIYGNWSGTWTANITENVTGNSNSTIFPETLPQGTYAWNCLATDTTGASNFSLSNRTIKIDNTPPSIGSVLLNETYLCGISSGVQVNCSVTDAFTGIKNVTIDAIGPGEKKNYSATLLTGDVYSANVPLNATGSWNFTCIAQDNAGNIADKNSTSLEVYSSTPDLSVADSDINFSTYSPYEGQTITISAIVHNNGCQDANNFVEGFYYGNPASGGFSIGNETISVPQRSRNTSSIKWNTTIGPANIFTIADTGNIISDANRSNNEANNTLNVPAWQVFYGNVTSNRILGNSQSQEMNLWFNASTSTGVIFVSDKESVIHWNDLIALGREVNGSSEPLAFSYLDDVLNMTGFKDSIANLFTTNGETPKKTENFTVESENISDVPVINSTNTSNFVTGIMWDSYYDTDGKFDLTDKEKVVFATKIDKGAQGAYGKYDYEVNIPVQLRSQSPLDNSEVYFYYELS